MMKPVAILIGIAIVSINAGGVGTREYYEERHRYHIHSANGKSLQEMSLPELLELQIEVSHPGENGMEFLSGLDQYSDDAVRDEIKRRWEEYSSSYDT